MAVPVASLRPGIIYTLSSIRRRRAIHSNYDYSSKYFSSRLLPSKEQLSDMRWLFHGTAVPDALNSAKGKLAVFRQYY